MAQLLIELFSEEIPARMQARGADELKRLITAGLKDSGLDFEDAQHQSDKAEHDGGGHSR